MQGPTLTFPGPYVQPGAPASPGLTVVSCPLTVMSRWQIDVGRQRFKQRCFQTTTDDIRSMITMALFMFIAGQRGLTRMAGTARLWRLQSASKRAVRRDERWTC